MIWAFRDYAFNESVTMKYHNNDRGFFSIQVLPNNLVIIGNDKAFFDFYALHGGLMWVAWGILGLIQLSSTRYLKVYWWLNMWIHRIAGTLILTITLTMGILAMQKT